MPQYLAKLDQLTSLVDYIAQEVARVVPHISANKLDVDEINLPPIEQFVLYVTIRSRTTVPELIASLVYISRFQQNLSSCATGRPSAPHRIFLTALNLAHKFHNDDSPENACWSQLSSIPECGFLGFSKLEVNLMERQFLAVVDWKLYIDPDLYDQISEVVCTTPSYPSHPLQPELGGTCGCCVCVEWWSSPTQGPSHCAACFTPSYAGVKVEVNIPFMGQFGVL